jgi:hypothetical protein
LHLIDALLQILMRIGDLVLAAIVAVELWLRAALRQIGLPPGAQTAILIAVAVVLIVWALRLLGGLIRVAVVLVVLLVAIHLLWPILGSEAPLTQRPGRSADANQ